VSISGLVVHSTPAKAQGVRDKLDAIPGVEIHAAMEDGRFVVTVDQLDDKASADILFQIKDMDGVVDAALVYNYFDQEQGPNENGSDKEELQ
jgi:nitrate reductase NapD